MLISMFSPWIPTFSTWNRFREDWVNPEWPLYYTTHTRTHTLAIHLVACQQLFLCNVISHLFITLGCSIHWSAANSLLCVCLCVLKSERMKCHRIVWRHHVQTSRVASPWIRSLNSTSVLINAACRMLNNCAFFDQVLSDVFFDVISWTDGLLTECIYLKSVAGRWKHGWVRLTRQTSIPPGCSVIL